MSSTSDVFVFWDDTAQPKSGLGGLSVVKAIRSFASKMGTIKSLKFYVDVVGAGPTRLLPSNVSSELQCSGVTIIDTVSNGRKGAPSKMMMGN